MEETVTTTVETVSEQTTPDVTSKKMLYLPLFQIFNIIRCNCRNKC